MASWPFLQLVRPTLLLFDTPYKIALLSAGKKLDDEQLKAEIGTFIMAGYETTAHTLSFTLYNIATHAQVQDNIVKELVSTGLLMANGTPGREPQYDDLKNLIYLNAVLKESMRMYPVVAAFPRQDYLLFFIHAQLITLLHGHIAMHVI